MTVNPALAPCPVWTWVTGLSRRTPSSQVFPFQLPLLVWPLLPSTWQGSYTASHPKAEGSPGGFVPFCHLYSLQLWLHCPARVTTSTTGKMCSLDPWLEQHLPMSATGSTTPLSLTQSAINHPRTSRDFRLHRSPVCLTVWTFSWVYLSGEQANQSS